MTSEMETNVKDNLEKMIEELKLEVIQLEKENKELKANIQKLKNNITEKFNSQEDDIYNLALSINEIRNMVKNSYN